MEGWAIFWGLLLAAALVVFAGLAIAVTVGSLGDIRSMLRSIDEQHASKEGGES